MSKRKTCETAWTETVTEEISNCTTDDEVHKIQGKLTTMLDKAKARLVHLRKASKDFTNGCFVEMTDSNESQDQDLSCNMCSREVDAYFTCGPNAAEFSIHFSNENIEGDETIVVESDLFRLEAGKVEEVGNEDITEFLKDAGLYGVQTRNSKGEDITDDAERRRWNYADIISEAVDLVLEKYGLEDSCGVALGMGSDCIYRHLGLNH
mmetsp:Transcript_35582/g.40524  ORF Transcript_35582/g.40524 Transcript_35582/m.40524 type:complete len:208 (+) Transcript_35582:171-794(+)|eukprot:CAMPEP_0194150624 /NCGR_PEP_ID=MMETSP0152-20130528/44322_1 /TAXON_ID=1049557 /ORGANISM="Thalassiothrix antarctica, Strain L6-D1" /LENGTH=207 /DNA_ID=CAMNT_0038853725 /DNA_START=22 /DNA_END=645 /DNA_ORIENTATION=+